MKDTGQNTPLVSVIMPLYNCERFVGEAIESVKAQTLRDWELVIVNDCSTDGSMGVVDEFMASDDRIRVVQHEHNKGAAQARNTALRHVTGRYVAYFDADDVWYPYKLEHQLAFMKDTGSTMCFTSYETIEEDGTFRNVVHVPASIDYNGFLKNTITCSHTIMFDLSEVSIETLLVPDTNTDYDFPEDMDTWLRALKRGARARGLDEVLAKNRKHGASRSANHTAAVGRTWNQYRRREGLPLLYACYCLFWQLFHAVKKRI